VQHISTLETFPASVAKHLARFPAAMQLLSIYQHINGAALFCTDPQDFWSAGLVLLPAQLWDEATGEVLGWLSSVDFQDDPTALPTWVRSAIPFGKIPGDASYWILPIEGPLAGKVLLSNDDVSAESYHFTSFDSFLATLRLYPEQIFGNGGYVSYIGEDESTSLYPIAYRGEA
jgi:hypothetical protein